MTKLSTAALLGCCVLFQVVAAAQIPRRWKTIKLPDVVPDPYTWRHDTCTVGEHTAGFANCVSELMMTGRDGQSLDLTVQWSEAGGRAFNCGSGRLVERKQPHMISGDLMRIYLITSSRDSVQVIFGRARGDRAGFNPEVLARIGSDFLAKISPFTIPCKGQPARPPTTSRARPPAPIDPASSIRNNPPPPIGNNPGDVPDCGNVFGQSNPNDIDPRCRGVATGSNAPSSAPRTMRSLPAVFPPGTRLEPLQFYHVSGGGNTEWNERVYSTIFSTGNLEYIWWELRLRYPGFSRERPFSRLFRVLSGRRSQIEFPTVEVDGVDEVLLIAETARRGLDPLNP